MIRTLFATLSVLAVALSTASAEEVKGKVKGVNAAGSSLTLTVDGKDKVFAVSKDASFVSVAKAPGKKGKPMEKATPIDGGLAGVKIGNAVTVLTEKVGKRETVTSVKVTGANAPGDAKKKKKKPAKVVNSTNAGNQVAPDKGTKKGNKAAKKAKKGDKAKKKAAKKAKKADKSKKKAGKKAKKGKKKSKE